MATSKKGLCKPKPAYTTTSCGLCPQLDTDEMVACDKCNTWFHFGCVGVTQEIENVDWICKQCRTEAVKLAETVSSRGLKKSLPPSTAWSFTTMSAKQKRLALLKLEEEQALRMEMINRKYEILSCDDEDSPDEETTRGKTYSVRSVRNNPVISSEFQQKPYLERADPTSSDDERELCNHMNFDDSHRVCLDRVTKMYEEKRNLATQCNVNDVSHNRNETFTMQTATIGQNQKVQQPPMDRKIVKQLERKYPQDCNQQNCFNRTQFIDMNRMKEPETNLRQLNPTIIGPSKRVQLQPMSQADFNYSNRISSSGQRVQPEPVPTCVQQPPMIRPERYTAQRLPQMNSNLGTGLNQPHVSNFQRSQPLQQGVLINNGQILSNDNAAATGRNKTGYKGHTGALTQGHIASRHVFAKDLPQFWGTPEEWPMFLSALITSTNECGFSDAENLGRLQRCLKGDAKELVRSHLLHAASVPGVIDTLYVMFGQPSMIIHSLLDKIDKATAPKDDDLNALIRFAVLVYNLSATIQSSGDLNQLNNPYLIQSITDKLPTQIQLNWGSFIYGRDYGLAVMGNWLFGLAEVATKVINPASLKISDEKDWKFENDQDDSSPSTYVNAHSDDGDSSKFKCRACNTNSAHALENCKEFKEFTVEDRWSFIKKHRLCGSCFGSHMFHKCLRKKKCGTSGCTREHHVLLHNTIESSPSGTTAPATNQNVAIHNGQSVNQMGSVNGGKSVVEQH